MSQPEARLQRDIQYAIRDRGGFIFKVHGSEYMMAGLFDLIVCYRGRFIGLEVKMPRGRVTERQQYVADICRAAGGITAVVYSVADALAALSVVDRQISAAQRVGEH